jgi:hypothetical protein
MLARIIFDQITNNTSAAGLAACLEIYSNTWTATSTLFSVDHVFFFFNGCQHNHFYVFYSFFLVD